MSKVSKKTIENLRDFMNRGCDYSGTQEIVTEKANEVLTEMGCAVCQCDDAMVVDWDDKPICSVEEFANTFWDMAVECFLNVLETE